MHALNVKRDNFEFKTQPSNANANRYTNSTELNIENAPPKFQSSAERGERDLSEHELKFAQN